MPMKISGAFDVKLNPLDGYATGIDGVALGRMSIDKSYYGMDKWVGFNGRRG